MALIRIVARFTAQVLFEHDREDNSHSAAHAAYETELTYSHGQRIKEASPMHACEKTDQTPCNAWCAGNIHVDIAYCDPKDEYALANADFLIRYEHDRSHWDCRANGPPCTILAIVRTNEALPPQIRYPIGGHAERTVAFRVTYCVHREEVPA